MVVRVGRRAGDRPTAANVSGDEPTRWLVDHAHLLPLAGDAIDVACGRGRNALWLAARGFNTLAVDRDAAAIAELRDAAQQRRLPLRAEVRDLEHGGPEGGPRPGGAAVPVAAFDVIVVVHYLHRPLFPALTAALRPGGVLVYETFTRAQALRGKPTNPAFLLTPAELPELVAPLEVIEAREGEFEGKMLASVMAVRRR
jgi:tellurite methyltransferase